MCQSLPRPKAAQGAKHETDLEGKTLRKAPARMLHPTQATDPSLSMSLVHLTVLSLGRERPLHEERAPISSSGRMKAWIPQTRTQLLPSC